MHTSELLQLYVSAQKTVNQSTLIEVKPTRAMHTDTKIPDGDIPFVAVFLAHICFMFVWGIVVFTVSYACTGAEDKDEIVGIEHLQQHHCENCQFFNNNLYLKCAVHPSTALTKQAINCSDYKSQ